MKGEKWYNKTILVLDTPEKIALYYFLYGVYISSLIWWVST